MTMKPADLEDVRARLNVTRREFYESLGIPHSRYKRMVDGVAPIPVYIALSCRALVNGLKPWGDDV